MQSVRHFKKSENWQKEGGRYIPSPANFLLDRRFEDVPESEIKEHEPCYDLDEYLKREIRIIFESLSKKTTLPSVSFCSLQAPILLKSRL